MSFTEANTVEQMILDAATQLGSAAENWEYVPGPQLPRHAHEVLVESWVREALIRLNPTIAAQPDRADEVIYNLRACILAVHSDGLVRANENFMAWVRGEKTMPFGLNGEHVSIRLVDADQPANNRRTVANQWTFQHGAVEKRFDIVLLINGLPVVIGEAKTPTRSAVTWFDGAFQVNEIYERQVPAMFVPNVFSFATEGKAYRYGSIRMPIDLWGPWRDDESQAEGQLHHVKATAQSMLRPGIVLDILQNFTLFATDKKHRRIKLICRYQQYETTNKLLDRVLKGYPKKGLIWHFQGSGKSLLMVFAAQKLRLHPRLGNPTVIIVVDRIDLDIQITATFNAADVPNMIGVATRQELQTLLAQDVRKVLITTIHKFGSQTPSPQPSPSGRGSREATSAGNAPSPSGRGSREAWPGLADATSSGNAPSPSGRGGHGGEGVNYRGGFRFAGLVERARELRQQQTPAEEAFWELVRNRQLADSKFRRQHQIGNYIVDFYCHEARLVVELDGPVHIGREKRDATRDKYLTSLGNTVLRFTNDEFFSDPQTVLEKVAQYLPAQALSTPQALFPSSTGRGGRGEGLLNERSNIIVMVDEAHRTQEGDLGRKMREALPNAFLFGLTGTPINRADKNTFWAFGADEDEKGYLSRYSFQDSIRDKATLPLHFEAPEVRLKLDRAAIDEAYAQITGDLSEQERDDLAKRAAKMAVLVKNPERVRAVVNHMVRHYQTKIEPNGFKAQVVVFDRECCVLYKQMFDELLGSEASAVVMHTTNADPPAWKAHSRDRDAEEKLLDRFRDPADPLKFVIVTNKLLTGFDAPILQVMYLDKLMKDHNLLQAICRTNRTFGQEKTHGLIVDYIGIFDDVARALDFDEQAVLQVVSNIDELRKELPAQMQKCLAFFAGVDRTVGGYEGLMEAQQRLPNNEARDLFAAEYTLLGKIWEALSPDPLLGPYETDFKWLTQVYESVKPVSGNGRLLWHRLGAKTVELINQNVHVESVRDDVDTLVLDAEVLDGLLKDTQPEKKAHEIAIKLIARLRKHAANPKFKELGERLEKVKERHEQGFLTSLEFLKQILEIAKDVVEAERQVEPQEERDRAKEALTELFNETKNTATHIIVERIVNDIDTIVKQVRFPDWQHTSQGERLVQKELRKTLLKYKLHTDQELFEKAYAYIKQYY